MSVFPGEPAPSFHARSPGNPRFAFDTTAGRNLVLTFLPRSEGGTQSLAHLRQLAASPLFDDVGAALFIVTRNPEHEAPGALPLRIPGVRAFFDDGGEIAQRYGLERFKPEHPVSFVITPRFQVVGLVSNHPKQHSAQVLAILAKLPTADRLPSPVAHAPVIIIPHVFEPELCRTLIEGYNNYGGKASGFMRDVGGKTKEFHDREHKVRRDWTIEEEKTDLIATLQQRFLRRVVPEIKKAFQFEATRMERYLVSCYSAEEGGHFRAHRDNTTRGTAHRRFAVSVNLNAEDYDGGDLRFPEFGTQTYRPPTGGCCVFSCSLLHEATPVTRGTRYAFLPFLYDEAARKVREENFRFLEDGEAENAAR